MKRRQILAAIVFLGFSSVAWAQTPTPAEPKPDLSGTWAFSVVYEGGSGSPTIFLAQKGDSLTGRYSSQAFGEIDLKGNVTGREFTFYFTTSAGSDPFTMTFTGSIEAPGSVKGTVDLGGNGTATFTGTRQKPPGSSPTP